MRVFLVKRKKITTRGRTRNVNMGQYFLEDKVPSSPESCPRGVLGQAICHRLCTVVAALHELSQSALPDGPCTEGALKVSASSARVTYEFLVAFFSWELWPCFPVENTLLKTRAVYSSRVRTYHTKLGKSWNLRVSFCRPGKS